MYKVKTKGGRRPTGPALVIFLKKKRTQRVLLPTPKAADRQTHLQVLLCPDPRICAGIGFPSTLEVDELLKVM